MLLKKNLEPTDFADAECRVSEWKDYPHFNMVSMRVWVCRCTAHWFHRHEWLAEGENQSRLDDWQYYGYFPHKRWEPHLKPAPNTDDL